MEPTINNEGSLLLPASNDTPPSFILPDNENPRNWSKSYRWLCVGVISLYGLMSPVMASAIVPALPAISEDLSITDDKTLGALVSAYLLSWAVTTVFLGSLSEVYGRVRLLHVGHTLFMIFNFLSVFARTGSQLLLLRFLAGSVGSGPLSIGAGIIGDLWAPEERGVSISLYTLGPLLGPAIGPIAAAYISANYSWRWIFGLSSIYILATLMLGLCILEETLLPVITQRKRKPIFSKLPSQRGANSYGTVPVFIVPDLEPRRDFKTVCQSLMRPFVLLWTQPIIQVLAIFTGYLFGLNHLTITTFQSLWRDVYEQDMLRASWNYTFIAFGLVLGSQVTGWINDRIYKRLDKSKNSRSNPELRTYMMLPASLLVPLGLVLYGWSAERHMHWLIPDIGIAIYGMGLTMSYQCSQAYIIDCYTSHAASSMGALMIVRAVTGFTFPIFASALFATWGYGQGSTCLAGCATIMGLGVPVLLKVYGPTLRARSSYTAGE
ncbi:putative bicyclomycin resistance protein [Whalleya microplaca]|nr:putative bicyclomycin resistance protein [Whalleya microplaca]